MTGSSIAHYRILSKLGEGGMGAVYRATDSKLNRDVAIKVLPDSFAQDPDRLARFTREAQVLAALNHPNIAAIYGVEQNAIVLELVEGPEVRGPLTEEQALPIIHQLIDALEYAHDRGIVHRDLKPANLKLTNDGRLKVLDFGLAKALATESASQPDQSHSPTLTMRATMAGVIMGTAAYMSPEQARGHNVDKRSDIWSFGVVLYELLTGKLLFEGETVSDTLAHVLTRDPDLSAIQPRFQKLLKLCLTRDPRQRLRDISGARLLLDEAPAPVPAVITRRGWIAGAAAAGLAAGAVAGYLGRGSLQPNRTAPRRPIRHYKVQLGAQRVMGLLSVSPDGTRIAYQTSTGPSMDRRPLCVRPLNAPEGIILEATRGAGRASFSPDGRWLAYWHSFAAWKIPVGGGTPRRLADKIWSVQDWSAEGVIVAGMDEPALTLIDGETGAVRRVAHQSLVPRSGISMLPGGTHLLVRTATALCVMTVDGRDMRPILDGARNARYLHSGHILFRSEGAAGGEAGAPRSPFQVAPFDLRSLRLTGPSVNLGLAADATSLVMDAFGTAISVSNLQRNAASALTIVDRAGRQKGPAQLSGATQVRCSPNGRFLLIGGPGNGAISSFDVVRGTRTRLTYEEGENETPAWSPDGKQFTYVHQPAGQTERTIIIRSIDGSTQPRTLWKTTSHVHVHDWSPDGQWLLIGGYSEFLKIAALPVAGGEPQAITQGRFREDNGQFSRDGKWIAYESQESGRDEVYVRPWPGPGANISISSEGGQVPRWSRDGKELLYRGPSKMMTVSVTGAGEFSRPRELFQREFGSYDILPDGTFAMFDSPTVLGASEIDIYDGFADELQRIAPTRSRS